ncbi:unnamed protein product [Bursaphelenchus xylophilus]|uniref:(pine wood nematode) hypothetical protein n=1 Tax=Bursaphelenchus xylophilus TaxID=6326 RepID=A0A1I7SL08_BURXY|nr:unnamed protein product [Bursaphelenchus xylophilus]CAG9129323.1 unnamed protein product [Bursaphelenchus xylophilus]
MQNGTFIATGSGPPTVIVITPPKMVIDFTSPTSLRQFKLEIDGRILYVNAHYLAEISPYFQALCFANFREHEDNKVELKGVEYEDMLEVLRCVCPDENFEFDQRISAQNLPALIYLSSRLLLQNLRRELESILQSNPQPLLDDPEVSTENLVIILGEAMTAEFSETAICQMCRRLGKRNKEEAFKQVEKLFPAEFAAKLTEKLQSYYYQQPLVCLKGTPHNWNDGVYMRLFF